MFSLNPANSVTKICHYSKRIRTPSHLLCNEPTCYHSASQTHVKGKIFKLSPIHASVIISFPEFAEFSESSAPFRKNTNSRAMPPTRASSPSYEPNFSRFRALFSENVAKLYVDINPPPSARCPF